MMRINVYTNNRYAAPVRLRKWVKNIFDAQSFCDWYEKTFGQKVNFVITR